MLPARVAGVHGDEDAESRSDENFAALEGDAWVVRLQGLLDSHDLLAHHRKHLKRNANNEKGGRAQLPQSRNVQTKRQRLCVDKRAI